MASDIATTKPEPREAKRGLPAFFGAQTAFSRIGRTIFLANLLGLAIIILGALLLSEWSEGLTQAQIRSLRVEGELIANVLVETSTSVGDPEPSMSEPAARAVLRRLLPAPQDVEGRRTGPRVRVFTRDGALAADTDILFGRIDHAALQPLSAREAPQGIERSLQSLGEAAEHVETLRVTPWRPTISLREERRRALSGEASAGQRLDERGQRVVSATVPIRRVQAVLGWVTVETADVERILWAERLAMVPYVIGAILATVISSIVLGLFVARPLRLLAEAADRLRLTGATRLSLPEVSRRTDEIGELSRSVEAMTGALADRIDANERFSADVSHELKNPLASIGSAVEAARTVADPAQQQRLLGIVSQDVRRLDRLITDMARASRIEAESARGELERVDIARMVSQIAESYAALPGEAADVAVVFRGPAPADAEVMGQGTLFGQVFRNLIDNAKGFSPRGGVVTLRLESARRRDGAGSVRVFVEDQGPGVPEENLETIFRRFYTQRPAGAAFGGNSGLGLSIARQIVESFGGALWAENIEGLEPERPGGARFIVELPLAPRGGGGGRD